MFKRIKSWNERRRARKGAREMLHHARHVRHTREDVARPEAVAALLGAEAALAAAAKQGDVAAIEASYAKVSDAVAEVAPARSHAAWRENVEIVLVAVAVAMGFRTYFVQPFKIPTGSMQPTLYGIHYEPKATPDLTDQYPLKPLKWLVTGAWHQEFRSRSFGRFEVRGEERGMRVCTIGGALHLIPKDLPLQVRPGEEVGRDRLLAAGLRFTGDHIFVNKVRWNFVRPRRGEVMVFGTDNIPDLAQMKTHYIKRMVGLPGDRISLAPPNVLVDGRAIEGPKSIVRVERREGKYAGYQFATPYAPSREPFLGSALDVRDLSESQYLACGDNTLNSFDSRYWGPVPRANLVGPAFMVYWPFSQRWGPMR
jgi:signal peptidase I